MVKLFLSLILVLGITGCSAMETSSTTLPSIELSSPAFQAGQPIPPRYTCDGEDSSPPLQWGDPPEGTRSFALIMDDPDAPAGTWVHWVVYNLPGEVRELPEGASRARASEFSLPQGAVQGKTSFNRTDYGGPCPPSGQHRYFFRLYALDTTIEDGILDKKALLKAMEGHILAQGELMGVYQRQ
ncbi:MAG TPA: YbhB/YbcL family Raf kinase inhibitor-like protein [Anaerolinea thermolimosa]|uniref:YbhB/YbcL family Raf kinase inhibitor-like protein n=1 Tax=Anaerolinea thermolimosa TaxID=229919 RepID=A0A3D1JGI9_9CHLR|nr:YbhB/YbcL family Raf kinase inhibitor-like protein [Anaerolinea thermolimosa]